MLAVVNAEDHFLLSQAEPAKHCQDQVEEGPDLTVFGHCQDEATGDVRKLKAIVQVGMWNSNIITFFIIHRFYPLLLIDSVHRFYQTLFIDFVKNWIERKLN